MKTLVVIRHAKSSWSNAEIKDPDRPLNERGRKDAPAMAKRLKKKGLTIDLFLSSTAKRAYRTAHYFAGEFGAGKKHIILEEKLYLALPETIYEVIANLADKYVSVAVFCHNPGITGFVNTLTQVHVDDMPTCSMFAVSAGADTWAAFENAQKQFLFFDYPKNLLKNG